MTRNEKIELSNVQMLVINAIDCLTANPPRRGAVDYLLSARAGVSQLLGIEKEKGDGK